MILHIIIKKKKTFQGMVVVVGLPTCLFYHLRHVSGMQSHDRPWYQCGEGRKQRLYTSSYN